MATLKMHRYIVGWFCLFAAFGVTLPIAMTRVSKTEKFAAQPFNSLTCEGQMSDNRTVIRFHNCTQMKVEPLVNASSPQAAIQSVAQAKTGSRSQPIFAAYSAINQQNPFGEAFRIAEQATTTGRTAQTSTDWYNLAVQWQIAADFMKQVSPEDSRYLIAQNRIAFYQQNCQVALQREGQKLAD